MKLRIMVLMLCGIAGVGASFAFASGGGSHGQNDNCRHAVVFGTASAPQNFTVTVAKSWRRLGLQPGSTLNVSVGSSGQTVRFAGEGCVGTDGTLTVREAELHVMKVHSNGGDGGNGQSTSTTTTTSDHGTTNTTTTNSTPPTTTNGDGPSTTTTTTH